MLTVPILMLFYSDLGFSVEESFQLKAFYSISIVVFEIPSGYLADVIGRRKTLIIGSVLGTIGFAIYSAYTGYWAFLIAETTLGVGMSCISGADSALLYDSLKNTGKEKEYVKYEGRNFSIGNYSEALAGLLGGILAEVSLRFPFYFQTGIAFIAIPAAILLVEPPLQKNTQNVGLKDILKIVNYSLVKNKSLRWILVYSSVIGAATLTMAWVIQLYLANINFSEYKIGFTSMILNLIVGTTTLFAYKIERNLKHKTIVWLTTIILTGSFIITGFFESAFIVVVFILFYFSRGIATPVLKDFVNRTTTSDIRATVLSIRSLIIRALFAVIGPLFGWISDKFSMSGAFLFTGLFFMLITGSSILLFLKSLGHLSHHSSNKPS
ncbi:MAG: MFS transporter [Marinilabiliaceae bacterium]|nr:MFS transporter [Marinilabiliaceae bacterium]